MTIFYYIAYTPSPIALIPHNILAFFKALFYHAATKAPEQYIIGAKDGLR
jgi:hypothetical protein